MTSRGAHSLGWVGLLLLAVAIAAAGRWLGAPRPFLDAYTPPGPYNWVSPPPDFAHQNRPPSGGEIDVPFNGGVSDPASAFTDDNQVTVSITRGSFAPMPGQSAMRVRITPVRPQPPSPAGLIGDGNAYRVDATYVPGGQPVAALTQPVLVDLRYPGHQPDAIYRIDGSTWTPIGGTVQQLLLSIDTRSLQLGTFIAGHRQTAGASQPDWERLLPIGYAILVILLILLIAGVRIRRSPAARRSPTRG